MVLIDANAVLRLLLSDNKAMENEVKAMLKQKQVLIRNEVMAEVVYVLTRVYKVERKEICLCLVDLLKVKNVRVESKDLMLFAIKAFDTLNIDFVDCLLYACHSVNGAEVFTFDKKLKKLTL